MQKLTCLLFALIICFGASASVTQATANGNWTDDGIWTNGSPGCFDTIIIPAGIQVDITSTQDLESCPDSILIIVWGRLEFQNGKKLKLPCLSDVAVMHGGSVGVGSGGGSSTYIEMCGTQYWNASSGDLVGPELLCDGGCPASMLPVELLYFGAYLNDIDRVVDLYWTTETEIENDYFTIQRSVNGQSWEDIGVVDGAGTSLIPINYTEVDIDPYYGDSYYRLKQTDFNGDFTYSPVVSVYQGGGNDLVIYPNPVNAGDDLNLDFNQLVITFPDIVDTDFLVQIYTVEGKQMYSRTVDLTQTKQLFIPIGEEFSSGLYIVSTSLENSKFIVR